MKPIELKARLLCEGANPQDEETTRWLSEQNPQNVLRGGLSSGLKALLSPSGFKVNFPLYKRRESQIKLQADRDSLKVLVGGEIVSKAAPFPAPSWYSETVEGIPITGILTQHNDQVVGSIFEGCSLFGQGEQCQFCVINQSQQIPELRSVRRKTELMLKALNIVPEGSFKGIGLNGGMTTNESRGFDLALPATEAISARFPEISIALEMTPPEDLSWIDRFAEAGGSSLMMNLETWDVELRRQLLPGKSKYCPRDSYFLAFDRAVKVLGEGKVSSCFVVGTEPLDSLKKGISTVVEAGVVPSPLAGRYFEQIPDYPFTPNVEWREFLEAFQFARTEMARSGLISSDQAGCVACGMCDIIGDGL